MTDKQKSLIRRMKRLFAECHRAEICFCGMDNQLLYFAGSLKKEYDRLEINSKSPYCMIAELVKVDHDDSGKIGDVLQDSGGW